MTLKKYKYFISVVHNKSISKAAKELNIQQPPLSLAMKKLEEELNQTLFIRGHKNIELTDAGKLLYKRAVQILDTDAQIKKEISSFSSNTRNLSVGMNRSIREEVIPFFTNFLKKNNDISINIIEDNNKELSNAVLGDNIELSFLRMPARLDDSFYYKVICCESMILYGHKDLFPINQQKVDNLYDFENIPLITYLGWIDAIKSYFNYIEKNYFIKVECGDPNTALQLAENKIGIAIIPESMAKKKTNYIITKIDNEIFKTKIILIKSKQKKLSEVSQKFFDEF